jgi:UDP-glucuronate 4-epimerase
VTDRRAFVTGAAGFIGSTLVDRLLEVGWRVAGFDNFDAYYSRSRKERNLAAAMRSARFHLIEGDTRDSASIARAMTEQVPSVVFDLAAKAGVRPSIADPAAYLAVNVEGLQNTLRAVAAVGARLVFASSSSVYGADPRQPFKEEQARGRPESPYGATKVAGEALVHVHHVLTGLPAGVARLFTVYGPRQRPDLAIHSFAAYMLSGEPIELFDKGRGTRDYTYVDDAVEALVLLAESSDAYLLVNVGSQHPVTTSQVADELERALGIVAERRYLPAQPGDVPATYADIGRARETLGWSPRTPFPDGIDRFCAWLRTEVQEAGAVSTRSGPGEPSIGSPKAT